MKMTLVLFRSLKENISLKWTQVLPVPRRLEKIFIQGGWPEQK
jgi:hypothetical protein